MKNFFLYGIAAMLLLSGCQKALDAIVDKGTSAATDASGFIQYTIRQGQQYCDRNGYKPVETDEMKFVVRFDSTAIYQTKLAENQDDINKLYGFSDNNAQHHQYSARFGWCWSNNALRLFAYVYNNGAVVSKELAPVAIGTEIHCSIQVTSGSYLFTVNDLTERLPRLATTAKAAGYQLYPYFGGNETAPHEIHIWIKDGN